MLLLAVCTCARRPESPALRDDQSQAIDALLQAEMKSNQIPGMAVAVVRRGIVVKQVVLGLANVEARIPVTASTPFQLASTTKSFVAAGVLLLVKDKRLTLEDPIGDLLPGLPSGWRDVTVRQLLSHTSGLPDIVRTPGQLDLIAGSWEEALPLVASAPHQFAPGEKWAYTQTNYALLARIVERLSGKTLEVFMAERLFHPLGMNETFFATPGSTKSCATNYSRGPGSAVTVRHLGFPPFVHAAGGLCASLRDLVRWNAALDAGRVLPASLTRELWTSTRLKDGSPVRIDGKNTGYGLGWVVDDTPGHKAVGHSGGNSTAYRRYLDDGVTIIVLHNGVLDPDALVSSNAAIVQRQAGDAGPAAQERLWDAARSGDTAGIERALADGADVEALDTRTSRNGRRALNWAAVNDHAEAIRTLLAHGAAIDAANKTGFTALHHAAESGSAQCVAVLLAAGANRSLANKDGERAADVARRKGHRDVAAAIER
jgi:CubicO group peptidase (beta-lactamase class C family)